MHKKNKDKEKEKDKEKSKDKEKEKEKNKDKDKDQNKNSANKSVTIKIQYSESDTTSSTSAATSPTSSHVPPTIIAIPTSPVQSKTNTKSGKTRSLSYSSSSLKSFHLFPKLRKSTTIEVEPIQSSSVSPPQSPPVLSSPSSANSNPTSQHSLTSTSPSSSEANVDSFSLEKLPHSLNMRDRLSILRYPPHHFTLNKNTLIDPDTPAPLIASSALTNSLMELSTPRPSELTTGGTPDDPIDVPLDKDFQVVIENGTEPVEPVQIQLEPVPEPVEPVPPAEKQQEPDQTSAKEEGQVSPPTPISTPRQERENEKTKREDWVLRAIEPEEDTKGVEVWAGNCFGGSSVSTYPVLKVGKDLVKRVGDPICDRFSIVAFENRYVVSVTDGCNWGPKPRDASLRAISAFCKHVEDHHSSIGDVQSVGQLLLNALMSAHQNILANAHQLELGTTTLIGGLLFQLDELSEAPLTPTSSSSSSTSTTTAPTPNSTPSSRWGFVCINVGDCKVYHLRLNKGPSQQTISALPTPPVPYLSGTGQRSRPHSICTPSGSGSLLSNSTGGYPIPLSPSPLTSKSYNSSAVSSGATESYEDLPPSLLYAAVLPTRRSISNKKEKETKDLKKQRRVSLKINREKVYKKNDLLPLLPIGSPLMAPVPTNSTTAAAVQVTAVNANASPPSAGAAPQTNTASSPQCLSPLSICESSNDSSDKLVDTSPCGSASVSSSGLVISAETEKGPTVGQVSQDGQVPQPTQDTLGEDQNKTTDPQLQSQADPPVLSGNVQDRQAVSPRVVGEGPVMVNGNEPSVTAEKSSMEEEQYEIEVVDLTRGNRHNLFDASDPGGRLGPTNNGAPDLRNLGIYFRDVSEGDLLMLVSDGIHDNLDPQTLGLLPSDCNIEGAESWTSALKSQVAREKETYALQLLRRLLIKQVYGQDLDSIDGKEKLSQQQFEKIEPVSLARSLTTYARSRTISSRKFLQANPNKKLPTNYQLYPGKMDHTTCLVLRVGFLSQNAVS
eukprot:TRINITY_DN68_c4_g3_i1.p1 TRINITY_DN68_c4_g3~~TRINITY_DN68_c4_g3_i1.p1  ORF type:complete len:1006 (+),score=211.87 TRINITY_DN68_c4_g3_i1:106-3123(+)